MDYSKYHYIVTVAELQSISKAAKALYVSQPALTKYINKMEDSLGVKLFNRKTIPITMTYAGEVFVQEAKKIIEIRERIDKQMKEIGGTNGGRLTIGLTPSRGEYLLPNILPVFKKKYPGINIKLIEGTYSFLEDQLLKGYVDIILTATPTSSKEIEYKILAEEEVFLIVPEDHELIKGIDISENSLDNMIEIDVSDINKLEMISLKPEMGLPRIINKFLEVHNVNPEVILTTENLDTAFKLAVRGVGITFTVESCVIGYFPEYLPVMCRFIQNKLTRTTIAGYKGSEMPTKAMTAFMETAYEVLNSCPEYKSISHEDFVKERKKQKSGTEYYKWFKSI